LLAFIHIHKTGGTTLQWIMRSAYGPRYCEVAPRTITAPYADAPWMAPATAVDLAHLSRLYPRLEGIGGHHVQPHADLHLCFPHIRYFTFMRDPVKMRASMYQHGVEALGEENCVLEDWLTEEQSRNRQTKMIAGTDDVDKAIAIIRERGIFVGLTDRFNESLLLLRALLANRLNIVYRRMNVAAGDTAAKQVLASPTERALLTEGNEADQALYDYVQHELYPAYRQEYGPRLDEDLAQYEAILSHQRQRVTTLSFMSQPRLVKLLLLLNAKPYNGRNVALALAKKYLLYRPTIGVSRVVG
jgi:hypothetical protein